MIKMKKKKKIQMKLNQKIKKKEKYLSVIKKIIKMIKIWIC